MKKVVLALIALYIVDTNVYIWTKTFNDDIMIIMIKTQFIEISVVKPNIVMLWHMVLLKDNVTLTRVLTLTHVLSFKLLE